ncbi:MAG: nucleotidyltransferase domain-containing protein [Chloroflexi bacterium]|nr:nucleotidyltransferase domain-containing protein [Chloroflexota bacterium]
MTHEVAELNDPKLAEIVRRLVDALHPERIYLFGSRARGEASADSDYDVLVLVGYDVDRPYRLEREAYHALWGVRTPVDVLVRSRRDFEEERKVVASLAATVDREGRLLYAA